MGEVQVLEAPAWISGPEFADLLGVSDATVCRWAAWLGYPPIGSGARRYFTLTDVLIGRAWQVITEHAVGERRNVTAMQAEQGLRRHAAAAIRRRPARWLIVTPHCGFTHPSAEEATRLALQLNLSCWWLIDLWSRRG